MDPSVRKHPRSTAHSSDHASNAGLFNGLALFFKRARPSFLLITSRRAVFVSDPLFSRAI